MADKKQWVITTAGGRPLNEIAREVNSKGFETENVLDEIGCITGTATDEVAKKVRTIDGVADVSANPSVDVGPPDSTTTW